MSLNLNKSLLIGNLTRDPELKTMPSGKPVCRFTVAVNEKRKKEDGSYDQITDFINVTCFGKPAENVKAFLRKGSQVYVEGKIKTRSWETPDGKRYATEVVADKVQFGNKPSGEKSEKKEEEYTPPPPPDTIEYPTEDINPEDIPF